MASFVLSFFPRDVLDEMWDLIESVSESFPTYSASAEICSYARESFSVKLCHSQSKMAM